MLPGDIDLTENIDFRKTRRKEISQLPNSWRGKNQMIIILRYQIIYIWILLLLIPVIVYSQLAHNHLNYQQMITQ